jgi:hypothetical protein
MKNKKLQYLLILPLLTTHFSYADSPSIDNLTQPVLNFSQAHQKGLTNEEEKTFLDKARIRHDYLLKHLDKPSLFIKYLLPTNIIQSFPNQASAFFEKEVHNIQGKLEIVAVLYENEHHNKHHNKHETTEYYLHQNDQIYRLHFSNFPPTHLQTDMIIKIQGFEIPTRSKTHEIVLNAEDVVVVKNANALPLAFGPQTYLSVLVNFSDKPTDRPWTADTIKNLVFTSVNNFYKEMSYNQTSVVGQQQDWVVVNIPSTVTCDDLKANIRTLADKAATAAGVDLTKFPRRAYFFPKISACTWVGLGSVGGSSSWILINGSTKTWVTAHEIGHNMGLMHAQALRCTKSPIDDGTGTCTTSEYGDAADTMGNSYPGHVNAFQKDRLGWLNYKISPPITTVTKSGSYFIDAYETVTTSPKALKLLKRTGQNVYYYLEYRQPIGFDSILTSCGSSCDFTKGILLHQGDPTGTNRSQLLDMTPGSGNNLVALLPCKSWTDPAAPNGGVTFTVQSISDKGARVKITYGTAKEQCFHQRPSMTLSPKQTPWITKGETGVYTLTIKNNDTEKCASRNFTFLNPEKTDKLMTQLSTNSLNVAPGETRTLKISSKSSYNGVPTIQSVMLPIKSNIDNKTIQANLTVGIK